MDSADDQITQIAEDDAQVSEGIPAAVRVAADRAKAEARKVSDDRRAHRRVPGRALDWINVARVKYGPEVNIVDLSRGGVLLESDQPLKPGSRQALEIAGAEKSIVVPFGVLRSRISALAPRGAIYRAACAFSRPLELPELAAAAVVTEIAPSPEPVVAPDVATPAPVVPESPVSILQTGRARAVAGRDPATCRAGAPDGHNPARSGSTRGSCDAWSAEARRPVHGRDDPQGVQQRLRRQPSELFVTDITGKRQRLCVRYRSPG